MQELSSLLFELSNEDRLNILQELSKNPMKLSRISEKFNFTVPETARNISRLSDANLIIKEIDGSFHLTPFGEGALKLLPGFEFLSKNKKYFANHTLSTLPPDFLLSLGALVNSKYVKELTTTLYNVENMIREAQEFIWVIADQILASALPLTIEAVNRGAEFRKILPRNADIPETILTLAKDPAFEHAAKAKKLESRYLDKVELALFISEKEVAAITFPNLEGKIDFIGFQTKDKIAHNWSKALFLNYWNKAKP